MAQKKTALVLIDIQEDYFAGGAFALDPTQCERAIATADGLLGAARASGAPIVHVRHENAAGGPPFLVEGTPGARFHPRVAPAPGEVVVTKRAPSSFVGTELESVLRARGVERIVVGGMIAWMCIDSTVRAAAERGFEVVLVAEMVASAAVSWRGRTVSADDTLAAALAPLAFFSKEASVLEVERLLGGQV